MIAEGLYSLVEFDGSTVTVIERVFRGEGRSYSLAVDQISSVEFQPAGLISEGFIRFGHGSAQTTARRWGSGLGVTFTEKDRVAFRRKEQGQFEELRDALLASIAAR